MTDFATYRRRETLVSAAINTAFSALFYAIVFGLAEALPVRGMGAFAFDFLPQSAAIGLMASLIPGLLLRRAMARGAFTNIPAADERHRIAIIVGISIAGAVGCGAVLAGLFWLVAPDQIGRSAAIPIKLVYGAALGATVTYVSLSASRRVT